MIACRGEERMRQAALRLARKLPHAPVRIPQMAQDAQVFSRRFVLLRQFGRQGFQRAAFRLQVHAERRVVRRAHDDVKRGLIPGRLDRKSVV